MNYKHLILLFIAICFFSCVKEETPNPEQEVEAAYELGIFVLNEGNFGSANASVSFINEENGVVESGIFSNVNGYELGDTAQSIELYEELAIIILNVSNKVEIVNRNTFESIGSITANLQNPRYAEVAGDRIYITNWGDGMDPDDDFVAVFNLADFSFLQSVSVPEGPEKLLALDNKLYVAHKGGFSNNNIISVIDAGSNSVQEEIEVGDLPGSMVLSGNDLWVLSAGKPSYADIETAGRLSKINTTINEVSEEFEFPEKTLHPDNLKLEGNTIYFTIGKSVYKYTEGGTLPQAAEYSLNEVAILYGFEIQNGKIYAASPNADFTGDGNLYVYDLSNGNLLNNYTTGINPNGIYFN